VLTSVLEAGDNTLLHIAFDQTQGGTRLVFDGVLDRHSVPSAEAAFELVDPSNDVTLDLALLREIDYVGISSIERFRVSVEGRGGRLAITGDDGPVAAALSGSLRPLQTQSGKKQSGNKQSEGAVLAEAVGRV